MLNTKLKKIKKVGPIMDLAQERIKDQVLKMVPSLSDLAFEYGNDTAEFREKWYNEVVIPFRKIIKSTIRRREYEYRHMWE